MSRKHSGYELLSGCQTGSVFDTLEPTADEIYEYVVEPMSRGRFHALTLGVLDMWCAMTGGRFELSSVAQVVVRERVDGTEVLRFRRESQEGLAVRAGLIGDQLRSMGPEEFRRTWWLTR